MPSRPQTVERSTLGHFPRRIYSNEPCKYCQAPFPHTSKSQYACGKELCQRERKLEAHARWKKINDR